MVSSASPSAAPRRPLTLHSTLLVAAALLLVALGVATRVSLHEAYRDEVQRALRDADRSAQKLAVRAREVLETVDQTTLLVKALQETGNPMDLTGLRHAGLLAFDVTHAVYLTDRAGMVRDTSSLDVPLNIADEDDFKRHARYNDLGLTIGVAQRHPLTQAWMMPAMRNVARDGSEFDGVVVALIDPAALTRGFDVGETPGTAISVIGLDNLVRSRLLDGQISYGGKVDAARLQERAIEMRETLEPTLSPIDQQRRFVATVRIDRHPLLAVIAVAADPILASYEATRRKLLAGVAAIALLIVAGAGALWQQARRLEATRQAEREAKALYAATLDGSLDALWLLRGERDAEGHLRDFSITDANRRAASVLGLERSAMIGRRAGELVPSIRHDGLMELLCKVMAQQRPIDVEALGVTPEVRDRWLHYQVVPVGDGVALIMRDITDRKLAEQQLAERESFFRTLLDMLPLAVYAKSVRTATRGRFLYWNRAAERTFHASAERVVGQRAQDFLPADIAARSDAHVEALVANPQLTHYPELVFDGPEGRRYLDVSKAPVLGADGEIDHILVVADDVTDRRANAERLRLTSRVVEETGDAIVLSDRDDRIVQANAAFLAMTGQSLEGLAGRWAGDAGMPALGDDDLPGVEASLREHRRWAGESRQQRRDGSRFDVWLNVIAIADERGAITHYARLFSDITVFKAQKQQLADLARRDALTGLPNRRHFEEELQAATARARRSGQPLALVYLDLDGFKGVNDTLGHEAGDLLLVEVARRLKAQVRSTDLVARLGGDEFTVLLENAGGADDRRLQCERLIAALSLPHALAGRRVVSTPSLGLALYAPGETVENLRRRADVAMYDAKRAGKACVRFAPEAASG